MSHDLRTPLRAIDGFSRELLETNGSLLDARGKEDLGRIRLATQRMGQLIEDLLELSRLSRSELKREHVNLSATAETIFQELRKAEPERCVESLVTPNLTAFGDSHLLRIALQNLIQNSWKFTRHRPQAKIEFGASVEGGSPGFYIKDNGTGFNMEYAGKLFQPFQRLHDAKEYPGTGIGLALVQRIIRRHAGSIRVEAEENQGATFFFTIPQTIHEQFKRVADDYPTPLTS